MLHGATVIILTLGQCHFAPSRHHWAKGIGPMPSKHSLPTLAQCNIRHGATVRILTLGQRHFAPSRYHWANGIGPMPSQYSLPTLTQYNIRHGATVRTLTLGQRHFSPSRHHWANAQPTLTANVDPMQHSAWGHCQNPDIGPTSFCTKSTPLGQRHWAMPSQQSLPTLTQCNIRHGATVRTLTLGQCHFAPSRHHWTNGIGPISSQHSLPTLDQCIPSLLQSA